MKVRSLTGFKDLIAKRTRTLNEEFDATEERAKELIEKGLVESVANDKVTKPNNESSKELLKTLAEIGSVSSINEDILEHKKTKKSYKK